MSDTQVAQTPENETVTAPRRTVRPRIDIHEFEDRYVVEADLPGVADADIDLMLEKDQLMLSASPEANFDMGNGRLAHAEFEPIAYRRQFTVDESIERSAITANMANGVLTLVLPKMPVQQPQKIKVNA